MDDIVVVGGGLAGVNAVETLREEGYTGSITLVGTEAELAYERPQLSKEMLKGEQEFQVVHDRQWFADRDVRVLNGVTVTALDLDAGTVALDTGESLRFEALLLATGAVPRVPGLPGVESAYLLRTVADARRLKDAITPGSRVALVGGGWIGLEVAAAARAADASAIVLEQFDLPLGRVLGPELAGYLADLHRAHGVDLRTGVTVEAIEPGGVRTSAGFVPADLVVMAVGAVPVTGLAEKAGLEVDGGIVVDEHLRTSDPRVYAAGDVALARHTTLGPLRVEHVDNARRQGQLAARSMLGQDVAYDWQPYFFTDQFEFSMEYVGRSAPDDVVVVRGDREANEFVAYWLRNSAGGPPVVTAGMNVNVWDVNDKLRELIGQQIDPEDLADLRG